MTMTASTVTTSPSVFTTPSAPVSATVARLVFERAIRMVPVRVDYPDGSSRGDDSPGAPVLELVRPGAFFARLGRDTKIGFGESYMAGDWKAGEGTDLADLLTPFAARLTSLVAPPLQRLRALVDRRLPQDQDNTLSGSRSNIAAHYDLSNELFAAFLDPTMTYSCALFDNDAHLGEADDRALLERAQLLKLDAMLDLSRVGPGTRLLEIGTGWGSLAVRAAKRGANVTSITLSAEQRDLALERVRAAGVADRVDIALTDYREVHGSYDAIVSIEMIEAVGEAYWATYLSAVDRLLAPGGTASIQTITMAHDRLLATRHSYGWIQKYIFPGGLIPSLPAIEQTLRSHTTLRVEGRRELGPHYARTLALWREQFRQQWPQVRGQGFDETFRRMWEFYLAYCEAGFRSDYLGVSQLQLARRPSWA
jgi:cyclopropane-fatty-acyl-phospholipid synthase